MKTGIKIIENPESVFLQIFGESPLIRIMDFFLENQVYDYTKAKIAQETGVSRVTLNEILPRLLEKEIIKQTRKLGNYTMYATNLDNVLVQNLIALDRNISLGIIPTTTPTESTMKQPPAAIGLKH